MKNFSLKLLSLICLVSIGLMYSCVKHNRKPVSKTVSLALSTPDQIKSVVKKVKIVSIPSNNSCQSVTLPAGQSESLDYDHAAEFMDVPQDVASFFTVNFTSNCFPYEVSMAYICNKKGSNSEEEVCYTGSATATLSNEDYASGHVGVKIKLSGQGSYASEPEVKENKLVSDFLADGCQNVQLITARDGTSKKGLLIPASCGVAFTKGTCTQAVSVTQQTANEFFMEKRGDYYIITGITIDNWEMPIGEGTLKYPVTNKVEIDYCHEKTFSDNRTKECNPQGRLSCM